MKGWRVLLEDPDGMVHTIAENLTGEVKAYSAALGVLLSHKEEEDGYDIAEILSDFRTLVVQYEKRKREGGCK